MKSIRNKFVKDFGEPLAEKLEIAAREHKNGLHDNEGSDPFKWVLLITIGFQCFEEEGYRECHKIKEASFSKIKKWIREYGELGTHDGDCDYITLACGGYQPFLKTTKLVKQKNKRKGRL